MLFPLLFAHLTYRVGSAPTYQTYVGSRARNNEESMQLIDRLLHGRLASAGVGTDAVLTAKLVEVEKLLTSRLAAVTEFANRPNATATSIVDALLAERASIQTPGGGDRGEASGSGAKGDEGQSEVESGAVFKAINQDSFRAMSAGVMAANVEDVNGRRLALVKGFANNCVLSIRLLCQGSAVLARKHLALGRLHSLRRHLPEYLTFHLVADREGKIPSRLSHYSVVGPCDEITGQVRPEGQAFLDKLLKFELQAMDWLFSPGGLLALKSAKDGGLAAAAKVHPLDIYTIPGIVKELGSMIHQILVCMGGAKEDTDTALTFQSWTDLYLEHLAATNQLIDDVAKATHLDKCHGLFALSLKVAGERTAEAVFTVNPDLQGVVPPPLPINEDPIAHVAAWSKRREASLDAMVDHIGLFPTIPSASSSNSRFNNPWVLPLRSQCRHPNHEERVGKKRDRADDDAGRKGKARAPAAGEVRSIVASHMWTVKDKELLISGKVWKIDLIARKLGVNQADYCWPVLMNARTANNRLAHCEKRGQPGHEDLNSAAHTLDKLDVRALVNDSTLWRHASEAEKAKIKARMEKAGLRIYPDKGIPKEDQADRRAPGRGRGRGRRGFR